MPSVVASWVFPQQHAIFPKDLYIPLSAIERVDAADHTVALNVRKGDIDETRWSEAPAMGSHSGSLAERRSEDEVLTGRSEAATTRRDAYAREHGGSYEGYRDDDDDLTGQAGGAAAGVVGGAAVGGAVGGPPGAVVGGALGAAGGAAAGDAVEDDVEDETPR